MSECDKIKGPETTVTGSVTDYYTKEPYPNIVLQVTRRTGTFGGGNYTDLDTVVTDANGSFRLTFTPMGLGEFKLYFKHYYIRDVGLHHFVDSTAVPLELGKINTRNFKVTKLVKMKVNLKNQSSQNRNAFWLSSNYCCVGLSILNGDIAKDTTFTGQVPRFTKIRLTSKFYNANENGTLKEFKHEFNIGAKDTTVNIINP